MKSFSILRTNTGLTTNMKIVVGSNYDLFMDSIDSAPELSSNKFKKVRFNKENYFDEMVPYFFKNLPTEIAFSIRYNNDNDNMFSNYNEQYDDMYLMGARNIIDNKNYKEEYEFFAPIYFAKGSFPKYFAIFRVDGPGLIDLTKDNFKSEIINKLKCVKIFDLTKNSPLGEWIEKNFLRNDLFPDTPLEVDYRKDEFTKWFGIDYDTGGYTYKSFFMNDVFEYENAIFDLEKFIFDGYAKNRVVFPNILNMSFLFDDTPATKTSLRKWSINRYYGFYLDDMDLVTSISPYLTVKLKSDVYIDSTNTLKSHTSNYPFDDNKSDLDFSKKEYYVEYLGDFYKIEQYKETQPRTIGKVNTSINRKSTVSSEEFITTDIYRYRIVSDISLSGKESYLNKNICLFDKDNYIIRYSDYSYFSIPDFDKADVWLIEIDGKYHNIVKEDDKLKVNTDYGFDFLIDKYSYYINQPDKSYTTTVSLLVDKDNAPKKFKIYRINFTDIKDFDTSIVDTEFSKYEYEKVDELTKTDETKMYLPDLRTNSFPYDLDDYVYKGEVTNIPVSSEYTANLETFRIVSNDLSEIWRKNPIYCRWGFQNSLSANDYPYLLNNSNIFEEYNRTVNPFQPIPSRIERNLDYFYTINSSTSSYSHHSLHVEDHIGDYINTSFRFDLGLYLNTSTYSVGTQSMTYSSDYFSYFFSKKTKFQNGKVIKNTKKYSTFNRGDFDTPNISLFRGIKFSIFDIENIKYEDGKITNINLVTSNKFEDYKLSILLSDNKKPSVTTTCYSFQTYIPGGWRDQLVEDLTNPPLALTSEYIFEINNGDSDKILVGDLLSITSSCISLSNVYVGSTYQLGNSLLISLMDEDENPISITSSCSGNVCVSNTSLSNKMNWLIVDNWDSRQSYESNSIVVHDDILYVAATAHGPINSISNNILAPYSYTSVWSPSQFVSPTSSILWNPNYDASYTDGYVIYNSGEYYKYDSSGTVSLWNPYSTYATNSVVIYKGEYWISKVGNNTHRPSTVTSRMTDIDTTSNYFNQYWEKTSGYESMSRWKIVSLWNFNKTYIFGDIVVYNNTVYRCITTSVNYLPTNTLYWSRVCSIDPDTNIVYDSDTNPVILLNDKYYIIKSNETRSTLENGINIYINKKWKNILINIAINDNTIKNISGADRDDLYGFALYQRNLKYTKNGLKSPINSKLTAVNLINCINDITNRYGFTDYLNYVIINEDGSINTYNYQNMVGLPHLIKCDFPDEFNVRVDSLKHEVVEVPNNLLKSNKQLKGGIIDNIDNLNYYNGLPLSYKISRKEEFRVSDKEPQRVLVKNTHGLVNTVYNNVYRHSGYYMPIFYEIELFERPGLTTSLYGNYKFDTSLTNFGKIKQRIISKVNPNKNIMKLKDRKDYKSIYPMLDEFGYAIIDFFIFKSTWDYKYHIECSDNINTNSIGNNNLSIEQ
jgi:hypothetical protein